MPMFSGTLCSSQSRELLSLAQDSPPLRGGGSCCHFFSPSLPSVLDQPFLILQAPGQVMLYLRDLGPTSLIGPEGWAIPRWRPWTVYALGCCPPLRTLPVSPRGRQEDWHLHNTRLGALAAGLKIVDNELAWNLLGDVGEAAGGWGVSTDCGGRERMSLSHSSEE